MLLDDDGPAVLRAAGIRSACASVKRDAARRVRHVCAAAYVLGTGPTVLVHRVLLAHTLGRALLPHEQVDHVHHREAEMLVDNRAENLRLATPVQQRANQRKREELTSRFRGVWRDSEHGCWRAGIQLDGRKRHLGRFDTEDEAARAWNSAAFERWAEYARLNEIAA